LMNSSPLATPLKGFLGSVFPLREVSRSLTCPTFPGAALPDLARPLCDYFVAQLMAQGVPTQTGEFGAHMLVEIENDGPVTISLELP